MFRYPTSYGRSLALVALVAGIALPSCATPVTDTDAPALPSPGPSEPSSSPTVPATAPAPSAPDGPDTSPTPVEAPTPAPTAPAGQVVRVVAVVDGDTVDLDDGWRVRLIGIDTPERGDCGYQEATAALARLVEGREVTLVPGARDNTDRYGRLLRYVDVDGVDANLEMIRAGWAIARYDSRDGYGAHAREATYVAADAASPAGCAAPPTTSPPTASPAASPAAAGVDDPRFGSCREAKAAGHGPYVHGRDAEYDWYRDGDGDGTVCE